MDEHQAKRKQSGHGKRQEAPGYPGGPWRAARLAQEARAPMLREARRLTRKLLRGSRSPRAAFLGPLLEGNLYSLLLARAALEKHGLGRRAAKTEWSRLLIENSQALVKLLDRLGGGPHSLEEAEQEPVMDVREYMAQKEAKTQATLSRKKSGPEATIRKGTGRTEGARFPDSGETSDNSQ